MLPGNPGYNLPRWRTLLRGETLHSIDGVPITSQAHLETLTSRFRRVKQRKVMIKFIPIEKVKSAVDSSIPTIGFNQMEIIRKHYDSARQDHHTLSHITSPSTISTLSTNCLTWSCVLKKDDWKDWQALEFKKLYQYSDQSMFGKPCSLLSKSNLLPLIWTYVVKPDGTKKTRCVCNGSPRMKGSVTLDNTYADSLEQSVSRLFWSLASLTNCKVYGANATNAFAEAPSPAAPLYVTIDKLYRNWHENHRKLGKIPMGSVLLVKQALQGHPESPRLWATHIHQILTTLGFKSCPHEPCLYSGIFCNQHNLFLRQLDDFAITCSDKNTTKKLLDHLDSTLKQPLKR